MAIDDRIDKFKTFKTIVGKEPFQGRFRGEVPEFQIKPGEVDNVYLTVKKMQRYYHNTNFLTGEYFAESFSRVEDAYLSQDLEAFQYAIRGLMVKIDSE